MAYNYTNIRVVLDKIMRHPMLQDITLETVVDYCIDFMRIVGVPGIFTEKVEVLNVENYRALLPEDFYQINQVRTTGGNYFRHAGDTFHTHKCCNNSMYGDLTYKIQGGVIITSIEEGCIEIAYQAIQVDEEGYPMIPDNSSFTRALIAYIKLDQFRTLFDQGKLQQQVFQNAQQEYAWAAGDCCSDFNRLTVDKAESLFNSWKSMIVHDTEHSRGFKTEGNRKQLRRH